MTNEMKLLRAFIEAQGYEVEKLLDYQEREVTENEGQWIIQANQHARSSVLLETISGTQEYKRGKGGSYFSKRTEPIIDYKVTKKKHWLDDVPEIQALMDDAPVSSENREVVPPVGFEATLLLIDIFNCDEDHALEGFLGEDIYSRMKRLVNEKE